MEMVFSRGCALYVGRARKVALVRIISVHRDGGFLLLIASEITLLFLAISLSPVAFYTRSSRVEAETNEEKSKASRSEIGIRNRLNSGAYLRSGVIFRINQTIRERAKRSRVLRCVL